MAAGSQSFDHERIGLFDLSHDAFFIAGFDGYLKRANPAFVRSLGYTLEETLARPFMDRVYPDDVEAVEAVLAELAGKGVVGFECREACADGSVRWFEWSVNSRPEAGIVYGIARDVTERRIATLAVAGAVQEISRGIHPAILSKGGLGPALKALARRSAVPVDLDLDVDRRLPDSVEVAAYYVGAEALTNAAKHAQASGMNVCVQVAGASLRLVIRDDGIGGAAAGNGSGLVGLIDRVEALGGRMTISSQPGSGTSLLVNIPLEAQSRDNHIRVTSRPRI